LYETLFGKGQHARAADRAEQYSADETAMPLRRLLHVKENRAFALSAHEFPQLLRVGDAPSERALFPDRVRAVGRGDESGALRADQSARNGTARFGQLGGYDAIDIARDRHERHHGFSAVAFGLHARVELEVIDGRTGSLRDPRHGSRLDDVAVGFRDGDEPVCKHAAALATERSDR